MLRLFGWLTGLAIGCLVLGSTVFINTCTALTSSPASGGSVIISANIAPVRYILVDNYNRITQIQSNTSVNVTPSVYKGSYSSRPIKLTTDIYNQYYALMEHTNPQLNGVIYIKSDYKSYKTNILNKTDIISIILKTSILKV